MHFALPEEEAEYLCALDEEARLNYVRDEIFEQYLTGLALYAAESDRAWEAMHRLLTDGYLTDDGGEYPLNHVILGGKVLYEHEDYILYLKQPWQVQDIAVVLEEMGEAEFRARYYAIPPEDYETELGEEDFLYTWEWFQGVRELYLSAASEGRYVLFAADLEDGL